MNKRQYKKYIKKIYTFTNLEDCIDKCRYCQNYENEDMSVGIWGGCIAPILFDDNDNIIEKYDDIISMHMRNLGYSCPYFLRLNKKVLKNNIPKNWKEYKYRKKRIEKYNKELENYEKNICSKY